MDFTEISAVLGIDFETANREEIATRAIDFCWEMVDCYERGSLEASAFEALAVALFVWKGGGMPWK